MTNLWAKLVTEKKENKQTNPIKTFLKTLTYTVIEVFLDMNIINVTLHLW